MGHRQLVTAEDAEFYVEVADRSGAQTVGLDDALSFEGVRKTVEAIATSMASAWAAAKPDEASVSLGLELVVKSGKLTGILVDGSGTTSLNLTLTWKSRVQ